MPEPEASERDIVLIDEVLNDNRKALAQGQAGVAALLALPYEIIARHALAEDRNLEEMVVRELFLVYFGLKGRISGLGSNSLCRI